MINMKSINEKLDMISALEQEIKQERIEQSKRDIKKIKARIEKSNEAKKTFALEVHESMKKYGKETIVIYLARFTPARMITRLTGVPYSELLEIIANYQLEDWRPDPEETKREFQKWLKAFNRKMDILWKKEKKSFWSY